MDLSLKIKSFLLAVALAIPSARAAMPAGYYSTCEGKGGKTLLSALHDKIKNPNVTSYKGLWTLFHTSDVDANGKIWDMYSTKRWKFDEQCGNYSDVGSCFNREHSFPKSWFDDASPMYSDAYHLYPTDGKVNGYRSNYPFGECANGTYPEYHGSTKPLGKLGKSTFAGYSGTVFEPDDEYKGDFARSYFYMAACYYDRISTWKSDMLAGNSYPAFKTWAINLLLKWHRQDPVSPKEKARQEVVYGEQNNRNPFIDYPELAEYIWGDKSSEKWSSTGAVEPKINQPLNGTVLDLGNCSKSHAREMEFSLKTTDVSENVSLSVSGAGYSVTPASVSAAQANAGTTFKVRLTASKLETNEGTLTVSAGKAKSVVSLTAYAVEGLPIGKPQYVTDRSFRATWTYIGDDVNGQYTLTVADADGNLDGYPRKVTAATEGYDVDGLQASTVYFVSVESASMKSDAAIVQTADPQPYIRFLFDGDLYFETVPGEPSEAAELLIDLDNIDESYTVAVKAPFELSANTRDWSQSLTLTPDEDRLYLRLNSATAGTFDSPLTATCGEYVNDDTHVTGQATDVANFFEDFEATGNYGSYADKTYNGTAGTWKFQNAGIYPGDDAVNSGRQAVRLGKNSNSYIELTDNMNKGIGTVKFFARQYNKDSEFTFDVQYSTDNGKTYSSAGTVTVSGSTYKEYSVFVGCAQPARVRLQQTSGSRGLVDDFSLSNYTSGLAEPDAARHDWKAYSLNGEIAVEVIRPCSIAIYCIDGTTVFVGSLEPGVHTFGAMPATLYIVAGSDFSRRVLVK